MRVVDASAVVELLLGGERGAAVAAALQDDASGGLVAPDLLDVEVLSGLRGLTSSGVTSPERAAASLDLLERMALERRPVRPLLPRMWALRENLSAYDSAYVALAEVLDCPLVTCDGRLAAAPGHVADVRLVG